MKIQIGHKNDMFFIIDKNNKIVEIFYSIKAAEEALSFKEIK